MATKEQPHPTKPLLGGLANCPSGVRLGATEEQQQQLLQQVQHSSDSASVLQLAKVCSLQSVASVGHTYSISLHSSSRSSSVMGSDSEDFEDNRDDAAVETDTWHERRQSSHHASSLEDQDEGTVGTAQQQPPTPTKRVIIKQVNSIFLQPTGPMMPNMPLMPMMQFIRPSVGPTDMPMYDINESYNPNYASTLPSGMPHPHDPSDSKGPQNMEVNGSSDPLAPPIHRHDGATFGPLDLKEKGGSEESVEIGNGGGDRCQRSEIQCNLSQINAVKSRMCSNDDALLGNDDGINQGHVIDEFINQSITPATHNAEALKN